MKQSIETKQTNVLVIGGGLAGARAAVEAAGLSSPVTLISKVRVGQGGAKGVYKFGRLSVPNGATDPQDNADEMFKDIIRAASGMCDEHLVRILSEETVDRFIELSEWGLPISDSDMKQLRKSCFATRSRTLNIFQFSPNVIDVLKQQIQKRQVEVIDNVMITDLLMKEDTCVGGIGVDNEGRIYVIKAKATIMATGGAAAVFPPLYDAGVVGSGFAAGFRVGAELYNMEFYQMVPEFLKGLKLIPFYLHPDVYNRQGERFLPRYLPEGVSPEECFETRATHVPFSSGDNGKYIDIAIYKEIVEGRGTQEGGVYFDFTAISEKESGKLKNSNEADSASSRQIMDKILAEPQQVRPDVHAFNGGFRINEKAETTLPGLYAAGEAAAGPHGADRLGGNMLAASLVFGTRAGRFASERANNLNDVKIDSEQVGEAQRKISGILNNKGNTSVQEMEKMIRAIMWESCLVVRNQTCLENCITELKRIRQEELPRLSASRREDVFRTLSIPDMLDVGEMIAFAALQRRESRGSHFREDFPNRDDNNFSRPITISKKDMVL